MGHPKNPWLTFAYVALVVSALVIGIGLMSNRYELVSSNNPMYGYKIDKLTGKSFFVYRNREVPMTVEKVQDTVPAPQTQAQ